LLKSRAFFKAINLTVLINFWSEVNMNYKLRSTIYFAEFSNEIKAGDRS
jgi:hypothetical protein